MPTPDYLVHPPAWFHTRILVGAGAMLTPSFMQKYNIQSVINCAWDGDSPFWFQRKYPDKYACLRAIDSLETNILFWYPMFENTIRQFLRNTEGTVFVHCQAGMNRSGFLALTFVSRNFGVSLDPLIQATKQQRPVLFQNPVFMKQVKEFINGCIPSSQDTRHNDNGASDGDTGFPAPRHSAESEGVQNNAGVPPAGKGGSKIEIIRAILHERSRQYCESKSDHEENP
jgi:hypothetical protein